MNYTNEYKQPPEERKEESFEILLENVIGEAVSIDKLSIPYRRLVALVGRSSSKKYELIHKGIYVECRKRMVRGTRSIDPTASEELDDQIIYFNAKGLLPAFLISGSEIEFTENFTIGDAIEAVRPLARLVAECGTKFCPRCDRDISGGESSAVSRAIKSGISTGSLEGRLFFAAHFNVPHPDKSDPPKRKKNAGNFHHAILRCIKDLREKGFRRFLVGDTLYRLSSENLTQSLDASEFMELLQGKSLSLENEERAFYENVLRLGVGESIGVVSHLVSVSDEWNALNSALYEALEVGGDFVVVYPVSELDSQNSVTRKLAGRWCFARGFACLNCRRSFTPTEVQTSAKLWGKTLSELQELAVDELLGHATVSSEPSINSENLWACLRLLVDLGLSRYPLSRATTALSSGEQLKLLVARYLSHGLVDSLIIIDEPAATLHPEDLRSIYQALKKLVANNNTVLVTANLNPPHVFSEYADWLIELEGAEAKGLRGLGFVGTPIKWCEQRNRESLDPQPAMARQLSRHAQETLIIPAQLSVSPVIEIPRGGVIAVTGRAGSGKTRLLSHAMKMSHRIKNSGASDTVGLRVLFPNQDNIWGKKGETIGAFLGLSRHIATVFAETNAARRHGLGTEHFMLEKTAGRCAKCAGLGYSELELQGVGTLKYRCERCLGKRFASRVLEITRNNLSITEALGLSVLPALQLFQHVEAIVSVLSVMQSLALGHVSLGRELATLNDGECQRLYLTKVITGRIKKNSLLLLDQPFSLMDRDTLPAVFHELRRLTARDVTIVFSTHDPFAVSQSDGVITVPEYTFLPHSR